MTAETLDAIKALGYKYSTRAAMTVSIADMTVPPEKKDIIAEAEATIDKIAAVETGPRDVPVQPVKIVTIKLHEEN